MKRIDRVNAELQKQLAAIIAGEVKDPRVAGSLITIVKVDTTQDLKQAKIYVSILKADAKDGAEVLKALNSAAIFMRNSLKNRLDIRVLPELKFINDTSIEYGFKISKILNSIEEKQ